MKNLVEVQLLGGDRFLIALCVMTSGDCIPFTVVLIGNSVRKPSGVTHPSSTHRVNLSIAPRTD